MPRRLRQGRRIVVGPGAPPQPHRDGSGSLHPPQVDPASGPQPAVRTGPAPSQRSARARGEALEPDEVSPTQLMVL